MKCRKIAKQEAKQTKKEYILLRLHFHKKNIGNLCWQQHEWQSGDKAEEERDYEGVWGSVGVRQVSLSWLQWQFSRRIHVWKLSKPYTLNMCSFLLYVNHISISLLKVFTLENAIPL